MTIRSQQRYDIRTTNVLVTNSRRRLTDDWAAYLGEERGQLVTLRR